MALQGTLDTFALPDVLRLLASTGKTGRLVVEGDRGEGNLDLSSGAVVGGGTSFAATDGPVDVLFELLRLTEGSFVFDQDAAAEESGDAVDVEELIGAAEAAHTEWLDLSTVVPSLDAALSLADDLPDETTTIDRDRWHLIVAVGGGTTVRALGARLGLTELPVLRAVRDLVDDGLAVIGDEGSVVVPEPEDEPVVSTTPPPVEEVPDGSGSSASAGLPSLDDDTSTDDLFAASDAFDALEDMPEPLPDGTVGDTSAVFTADDAAALEAQLGALPDDQRAIVERAADLDDPDAAEALLDELPDGVIDRDLVRRFLRSGVA